MIADDGYADPYGDIADLDGAAGPAGDGSMNDGAPGDGAPPTLGLLGDTARIMPDAGETGLLPTPLDPDDLGLLSATAPTAGPPPPPPTPTPTPNPPPPAADDRAGQLAALKDTLTAQEGRRHDVYLDSEGVPTVGIGHKVLPGDGLKLGDTIGDDRIAQFFAKDGGAALDAAQRQAATAGITDPKFIPALASVNLQLGPGWTGEHPKTWAKMRAGDYAGAADEAARSKWYGQTPKRVRAFQAALRALPPLQTR